MQLLGNYSISTTTRAVIAHYIGGGTGGGYQGHVPPLGKDLPFSAPPLQTVWYGDLWPYPVAGTRAVMAERSLNMASGSSKTLGPSILAALSPNINLSTNMASETISEHLILNIFLGEHGPRPPWCVHAYAHTIISAPQIVNTFGRLCTMLHLLRASRPTHL